MAEDALRRELYGGQLQSLMDRDSLARSIRPPIMAGQEGVEGGQTIVPPLPSADPASVSSAGTGSPREDPPVVLPSASTARSSFLSGGSLVHSGHQRPVAVGEKEGEFGGTPPQPGVAKAASEGYFSAAEGSHEVMTVPPLPLGLDPALTQESQLEEGPRHSSSSSMSPPPMAGDVLTVSSGLPEAQNVLEQLAQLHPSWGEEGRESSESMSAISSEGSLNFEDTQQPRFNPFDSGAVCGCGWVGVGGCVHACVHTLNGYGWFVVKCMQAPPPPPPPGVGASIAIATLSLCLPPSCLSSCRAW